MDTNNLPSYLQPDVSANEFFQAILKSLIKRESNSASMDLDYEVICKGVPFDVTLKISVSLEKLEVQKNVWIDWTYTPENPYPQLDGDPLVHVRFRDGETTMDSESVTGARPISYWHGDGFGNSFAHTSDVKEDCQIIAYMLVDENDHD